MLLSAGLGPLQLEAHTTQYALKDFRTQLRSALCDEAAGPIETWLWLAGDLTPAAVGNTSGAAAYLSLLHSYSTHNGTDLCQP